MKRVYALSALPLLISSAEAESPHITDKYSGRTLMLGGVYLDTLAPDYSTVGYFVPLARPYKR